MFALMRGEALPNRLRRPSQDGEFFLLRVAGGGMDVDAGRKMGGCRCGVQDVRGVADAPPRKKIILTIYDKMGMYI